MYLNRRNKSVEGILVKSGATVGWRLVKDSIYY